LEIQQGALIELDVSKQRLLVLSKAFFNRTGLCVVCPVVPDAPSDALHLKIKSKRYSGTALCEHLKTIDLKSRHYRNLGTLSYEQVQETTDAIQAIFDYYPFD